MLHVGMAKVWLHHVCHVMQVKETINVQNITSVLPEASSDGMHFPLVVTFMGKGSPWNLRAYSEVIILLHSN